MPTLRSACGPRSAPPAFLESIVPSRREEVVAEGGLAVVVRVGRCSSWRGRVPKAPPIMVGATMASCVMRWRLAAWAGPPSASGAPPWWSPERRGQGRVAAAGAPARSWPAGACARCRRRALRSKEELLGLGAAGQRRGLAQVEAGAAAGGHASAPIPLRSVGPPLPPTIPRGALALGEAGLKSATASRVGLPLPLRGLLWLRALWSPRSQPCE
jgi:hypothetical protein